MEANEGLAIPTTWGQSKVLVFVHESFVTSTQVPLQVDGFVNHVQLFVAQCKPKRSSGISLNQVNLVKLAIQIGTLR
jgi:hypothetical protein